MAQTWTVGDVVDLMDRWYPPDTAEDWDRPGLVLGRRDTPVHRILLAVDPVAAVVDSALRDDADMVITHHPLYLRGTSFLPEEDPKGATVARLVRSHAALFTAHTNADIAHLGVSAALAEVVGLRDAVPLVPAGTDAEGRPVGHGRIGAVEACTLDEFADRVARALPAGPHGLLVGGDPAARITRVAVSGGAGESLLRAAGDAGAEAFLTADLRHHPASEHLEGGGPALLCASHWATEWPWLPVLASRLRERAASAGITVDVEVPTMVTEPWTTHRPTTGGQR